VTKREALKLKRGDVIKGNDELLIVDYINNGNGYCVVIFAWHLNGEQCRGGEACFSNATHGEKRRASKQWNTSSPYKNEIRLTEIPAFPFGYYHEN